MSAGSGDLDECKRPLLEKPCNFLMVSIIIMPTDTYPYVQSNCKKAEVDARVLLNQLEDYEFLN